ncbi:low affinity immunoglobulin gamma Fc region receptor III-A-like [Diretmus argenteus]
MGNLTSSALTLRTGVPQGCVLSPLLFALFTHDCVATRSSNVMFKFADDTILGLISNDDGTVYREEVTSLTVVPDKSQFFQYDSVSLSCGQQGNPPGWRVNRTTMDTGISSECNTYWGIISQSQCFISDLYPEDTGVYWCESGAGECSNAVNITVTDGAVILESPALPVTERDAVTLRCRTKTTPSDLPADFYKDGVLIESGSTGEMTIHSVSRWDEGLYKCNISECGESPESWLAVREAFIRRGHCRDGHPPCGPIPDEVAIFIELSSESRSGLIIIFPFVGTDECDFFSLRHRMYRALQDHNAI